MPGNNDRSERWTGGFVRSIGEGPTRERVYVIRRMIDGHRYEVSTKRSSEAEAILELLRFQKDPATYDPTPTPDLLGNEGPAPVYLDARLVEEYLAHCAKVGTTHQWLNSKRRAERSRAAQGAPRLQPDGSRQGEEGARWRAEMEARRDHASLGYGLALLRGAALRGGRQHREASAFAAAEDREAQGRQGQAVARRQGQETGRCSGRRLEDDSSGRLDAKDGGDGAGPGGGQAHPQTGAPLRVPAPPRPPADQPQAQAEGGRDAGRVPARPRHRGNRARRDAGGGERFPRPPEPADREALLLDSLGRAGPTLGFLEKVASALGAKLDVRLRG